MIQTNLHIALPGSPIVPVANFTGNAQFSRNLINSLAQNIKEIRIFQDSSSARAGTAVFLSSMEFLTAWHVINNIPPTFRNQLFIPTGSGRVLLQEF
ncbi:MAG: hypothetical protein KIS61_36875, partial [Candidatus Eremiobacteraeota bacterium]|nr:hypothetical protein [Candidatus Eremiobacteraeota bacterium]